MLTDNVDMQQETQETQDTQETQETQDISLLGNNTQAQETQPKQVDWQTLLGDYAEDPNIQKFKDPKDLAKSYIELQKLVGREKIPVPKTDEELQQVLMKLGVPETPDKYPEFDDAEQVFGSKEEFDEFKKVAHETGLLPQQFEALYSKMKEIMTQSESATLQERQSLAQQSLQQLTQEFGQEAQSKIKTAQKVFQMFPDDVKQAIVNAGLDVNANFVKTLANLGEYYKEDSFVASGYSKADAKGELENILQNKSHPYFDRTHPEHEAAVEKVEKLYRIIYG